MIYAEVCICPQHMPDLLRTLMVRAWWWLLDKKKLKLFRSENQDGAMAAILEIYFALLLLNWKANLSGNQVSDTGPSWPSCFFYFFTFIHFPLSPLFFFFHLLLSFLSLFSLSLGDDTKWPTRVGMLLNPTKSWKPWLDCLPVHVNLDPAFSKLKCHSSLP